MNDCMTWLPVILISINFTDTTLVDWLYWYNGILCTLFNFLLRYSRGNGGFSAILVFLLILHESFVCITKIWSFASKKSKGLEFTLSRSEVNTHQFNVTAELLKKAVEIRVEFRRPSRHAFPILLLFRLRTTIPPPLPHILCLKCIYTFNIWKICKTFPFHCHRIHQRPTPSLYNVCKVYHWKGQVAQIFLPPSSLKGF